MPGTKKPKRKGTAPVKRAPGRIAANAHEVALDRRRLIAEQHRLAITKPAEEAYTHMCQGTLDRDGWAYIAGALNAAEQLAKLEIGSNLLNDILRGQEAMLKIGQRLNEAGRVTCYGLEITTVRDALDYFNIQMRLCTAGEYDTACYMAERALRSPKTMTVVPSTRR